MCLWVDLNARWCISIGLKRNKLAAVFSFLFFFLNRTKKARDAWEHETQRRSEWRSTFLLASHSLATRLFLSLGIQSRDRVTESWPPFCSRFAWLLTLTHSPGVTFQCAESNLHCLRDVLRGIRLIGPTFQVFFSILFHRALFPYRLATCEITWHFNSAAAELNSHPFDMNFFLLNSRLSVAFIGNLLSCHLLGVKVTVMIGKLEALITT